MLIRIDALRINYLEVIMGKIKWCYILIIPVLFCFSCNSVSSTATDQMQNEIKETVTPTGGALGGIAPSGGSLEINIPFDLYASDENLSGTSPVCNVSVPFLIKRVDERIMVEGEKEINCEYVDTPQGSPITFMIKIVVSFDLLGELLPATIDKPAVHCTDGFFLSRCMGIPHFSARYHPHPSSLLQ